MESPGTHQAEDHQTRTDHKKSYLGVRPESPQGGGQDQTHHSELDKDAGVSGGKQQIQNHIHDDREHMTASSPSLPPVACRAVATSRRKGRTLPIHPHPSDRHVCLVDRRLPELGWNRPGQRPLIARKGERRNPVSSRSPGIRRCSASGDAREANAARLEVCVSWKPA